MHRFKLSRLRAASLLFLPMLVAPSMAAAQAHDHPRQDMAAERVPLYDNLGDHAYSIRTSVPEAQEYFDQGLRLYYAFNHTEAIRAFREAQRLDPDCAMCWWGEALAWGPNINLPMDSTAGLAAREAVEQAAALKVNASERERALIDALMLRYEPGAPAERAHLDSAYARAMADVSRAYPDDPEAAVLHAESLLDLRPWDYWTPEGQPQPGIGDALTQLERVIEENPDHPGACHFFIHAVEKEYPERAVPCAENLASLMPGAGHIVHMPGHIYIRVGRYQDAIEANQHAVHADETYIRDQSPAMSVYTAGYYPHNYDFLAFAASMIGRRAETLAAAEQVAALIPEEMFGTPGMAFLEHWAARPYQMRVRFSQWDEILATPAPDDALPHTTALWHYAHGRALAATGDPEAAERDLAALRVVADDPQRAGIHMEFNAASDLLHIAEQVLTGWIASAQGRHDDAVAALEEAVRLEDGLLYGEPPEWSVPARYDLGSVLLAAGRPAEAEQAFRADLDHFPANGWSLAGLTRALREQGREAEAAATEAEFERVWSTADVTLDTGGR